MRDWHKGCAVAFQATYSGSRPLSRSKILEVLNKRNIMIDIVLIAIPYAHPNNPPLGISVLNGIAKAHGFTARSVDLIVELSKSCSKAGKDFESTQIKLRSPVSNTVESFVDNFFDQWIDTILSWNPKYIGISVFSYYMHFSTFYLCEKLQARQGNFKIVLGGAGVGTPVFNEVAPMLGATSMQQMIPYGEFMKAKKLADHVIVGDGEQALIDLLSGDADHDDTKFNLADYKQELPFSNFDDFNLYDYPGNLNKGYPQLPIFTSKGCVRDCDFCDVNSIQQKFRFRQGANVVKEMLHLANRYNIREFNFTDSLVNGSLKSMTEWITALAEYNRANPDRRITWSGSWICRPIGQIKEHVYKLLAESGCETLAIGVESGSNHVLQAMDKKTNVEALMYETEMFHKYGIKFITLLIVGHWSERWEDFMDTIHMLYRLKKYVKTGNYVALTSGTTMEIVPGSPMDNNFEVNRLEAVHPSVWWTSVNPSLTVKERYFRLLLLEKFCKQFNLPLMERVLPYVSGFFEKHLDTIKDFYHQKTQDIHRPVQHAEFYLENFDQFVELVESKHSVQHHKIELTIVSHSTHSNPGVVIEFNGRELKNCMLPDGGHSFVFDNLNIDLYNKFLIRFTNKNSGDTIVDQQGCIIKDKFLEITKFTVNDIDLLDDIEFFQSYVEYVENDKTVMPKFGFWFNNATLCLAFDKNFSSWYHKHSKKNTDFDVNIITTITTRSSVSDDNHRQQIIKALKSLDY